MHRKVKICSAQECFGLKPTYCSRSLMLFPSRIWFRIISVVYILPRLDCYFSPLFTFFFWMQIIAPSCQPCCTWISVHAWLQILRSNITTASLLAFSILQWCPHPMPGDSLFFIMLMAFLSSGVWMLNCFIDEGDGSFPWVSREVRLGPIEYFLEVFYPSGLSTGQEFSAFGLDWTRS